MRRAKVHSAGLCQSGGSGMVSYPSTEGYTRKGRCAYSTPNMIPAKASAQHDRHRDFMAPLSPFSPTFSPKEIRGASASEGAEKSALAGREFPQWPKATFLWIILLRG